MNWPPAFIFAEIDVLTTEHQVRCLNVPKVYNEPKGKAFE